MRTQLFILTRSEEVTILGEVKTPAIQTAIKYEPVVGSEEQTIKPVKFNISGRYEEAAVEIIERLTAELNEGAYIYVNKTISRVGRAMDHIMKVALAGEKTDDTENLKYDLLIEELAENEAIKALGAIEAGATNLDAYASMLANIYKEYAPLAAGYAGATAETVLQIKQDLFDDNTLTRLARLVLLDNKFDNLYYIPDNEEEVYRKLSDPKTEQFWRNINDIKRSLINLIPKRNYESYQDVAPIKIIFEEE